MKDNLSSFNKEYLQKHIENNVLNLKMLNKFSLNLDGTRKPIINNLFNILLKVI